MSERRHRFVQVALTLHQESELFSLRILGVLCVSAVKDFARSRTAETQRTQRWRRERVAVLLASSLVTSCSRAPSFDIFGSYFPAWLICLALGVVFTAVIRWLLLRFQIAVVFPILVYPSLTALFAFGMWLVFYG